MDYKSTTSHLLLIHKNYTANGLSFIYLLHLIKGSFSNYLVQYIVPICTFKYIFILSNLYFKTVSMASFHLYEKIKLEQHQGQLL